MISFFEDVIEGISRNLTSNDSLKYCDLTTVVGLTSQDRVEHPEIRAPYILTTKNNDFLTVIEVQGAKSSFDESRLMTSSCTFQTPCRIPLLTAGISCLWCSNATLPRTRKS